MDPKSGKPVRLFNPLSIWLKSGEAILSAAQAAIARPKVPKVAVLHSAEAPSRKAAKTAKAATRTKVTRKAKGKKRRAKR